MSKENFICGQLENYFNSFVWVFLAELYFTRNQEVTNMIVTHFLHVEEYEQITMNV